LAIDLEYEMKQFKIVAIALAGMSPTAYAQTTLGVTANQNAVGAVLTAPIGVPDADTQTLITAATVADPVIRSSALAQLSPQAYSLLPEVSLNGVELQETNILRYVRDLRGNAERPDGSEVPTERLGRVGFFALGGARFGSYDAATDRTRVKNDNYAFMGGADFRLTPKTTIGAFGGWQQSDVDLAPGPVPAPTKLKSWFAGGFGTAGVGPVYVDFWGSYNDLDWTLNRGYAFGDTSASLSAKTDGRVWAAGVATGLSFSAGNFEIEPFATLRYADIKIDGFSESGSPAALNVSRMDVESLRLNLGGRIGTKFEAGNVTVRPQLRGGWYREFKLDDPRTISTSFRSAAVNTPFAFVTSPLTNEYYNAGAALNIAGTGPVSMVVDYDVQFDDDRQFHALSLSARFKF
jgi:outer membrane autotransporter protein